MHHVTRLTVALPLPRNPLYSLHVRMVGTFVLAYCLSMPPVCLAGVVTSAAERSAAKATQKSAANAARAQAERAALQQAYRELDRRTLAIVEKRYGSHIPPPVLKSAPNTPVRIEDAAAFDKRLQLADPKLTASERQAIVGFYYNNKIDVNGNNVQVPLTLAHERLHQLSHPRFRELMGGRLDEGVTELYANRIFSDLGLSDAPKIYPKERQLAAMLEARIGPDLASAFFKGELGTMRKRLDSQLGNGAFSRLEAALRSDELDLAIAVVRGSSP